MYAAILLVLALVAPSTTPAAADQQAGYVVIVNEANDIATLSAGELSRMFLKKTNRWDSGLDVVPVDLPEDAPVRAAFSAAVHGKPVAAIHAYWQQQIFSGRAVPPTEKPSDDQVVAFVRATPGAVGYVASSTPLTTGVRRLQVIR